MIDDDLDDLDDDLDDDCGCCCCCGLRRNFLIAKCKAIPLQSQIKGLKHSGNKILDIQAITNTIDKVKAMNSSNIDEFIMMIQNDDDDRCAN